MEVWVHARKGERRKERGGQIVVRRRNSAGCKSRLWANPASPSASARPSLRPPMGGRKPRPLKFAGAAPLPPPPPAGRTATGTASCNEIQKYRRGERGERGSLRFADSKLETRNDGGGFGSGSRAHGRLPSLMAIVSGDSDDDSFRLGWGENRDCT